ncbi:phosphatidate cytidylyltransferase [Desulfuromonas versatilis]|uniref:Phosphatidate cytidylyltransferase n=1 Tax=Desulfuromonas versatilis TaxID=2802975 RepID=A0ABN6DZ86_9BACT|nr:phosphatidate cytidylyltransferase [Desulfuromonas versatilis]
MALVEFYAMSLAAERSGERALAIGTGVLLPLCCLAGAQAIPAALTLVVLLFATLFLFRFGDLAKVVQHLSLVLLGYLYIPVLLSHMVLLRELPYGREWIFLVLVVVMAGDTSAYFTGINFGRRKLYPAISPNKSVEGALGGLAGSVFGAALASAAFLPVLSWLDCLVVGLGLGALGQVGDLFESMLKRSFGVKDSGRMIPGHGGILDRLDSLLFAFPAAYYFALLKFAGQG